MDVKIVLEELSNPELYINILASLKIVLLGFFIAFIVAISLAVLLN